ncbi:MAG: 3-deoxy-D-manno-octulosonic acid transferase [Planctomycetes bacterium]|nr:3-deoxy-D-manno-octulosonic acid transferase [Planctomycetota bacterium]
MPYLLNLAFIVTLALASPWLLWQAIRRGKYRAGWGEKFLGHVPTRTGAEPCLWLHAVSVGEVNVLATLIKQLQRDLPGAAIVISTTTHTGYELARKKYAGHTVFYCPLDFTWAVRAAMRRVRPTCLVLAELELWPNLIRAAKAHGARVAVINGRLSEHSFRGYRRWRALIAPVMRDIDLIAAQNQEYAERFLALGAKFEAVFVSGNLKFDGAQTDRNNPTTRRLATLAGFSGATVFLAGSTQEPEESLALEAFCQLAGAHPNLRLILVPRHPDRFDEVARLLDQSGVDWARRSKLENHQTTTGQPAPRVLLVDTVGELGAWWGTATIAYVGGSMGSREGQNMIEPAAYGAAVAFGPRTKNFRDVVAALMDRDAAEVVHDGPELRVFVERCLTEPGFANQLGQRAQSLVREQLGATARTVELLGPLVPISKSPPARAA